jgi:hypothetical protein
MPSPLETELANLSASIATKVSKSGDTMSGTLNMNANRITNLPMPLSDGEPLTVAYQNSLPNYLKLDGTSIMANNINAGTHKIVNLGEPTSTTDAATKIYVDEEIIASQSSIASSYVPKTGISGNFSMNNRRIIQLSDPIDGKDAATADYAELVAATARSDAVSIAAQSAASLYALQSESVSLITSDLNLRTYKLVNVGYPTTSTDAATKAYTDTVAEAAEIAATNASATNANTLYARKSGATFTGQINMSNQKITGLGIPLSNSDATTKQYVDTHVSTSITNQNLNSIYARLDGASFSNIVDMTDNRITGLPTTPTDDTDATSKVYVDSNIETSQDTAINTAAQAAANIYLPLNGGLMTGDIHMNGNRIIYTVPPLYASEIVTKNYVDSQIDLVTTNIENDAGEKFLQKIGGIMSGNINMNSNKIINVGSPTANNDAVNKEYIYENFISSDGGTITNLTQSTTPTTGAIVINGGLGVVKNVTVGGILRTTDATDSSSTTSGSITTLGGIGVIKSANIGGTLTVENTGNAISSSSASVVIKGGLGLVGNMKVDGPIKINNSTNSSNSGTGALIVSGGIGFGGNLIGDGIVTIENETNSTNATTGAIVTSGGLGVGLNATIGGTLNVLSSDNASSSTNASIVTSGGIGIEKDMIINGNIKINSSTPSTSQTTGCLVINGGLGIVGAINTTNNITTTGKFDSTDETQSTSLSTGSIVVKGGIAVAKNANIGGNVNINSNTTSTSYSTGSLIVGGGVGIAGILNTQGEIYSTNMTQSTSTTTGALTIAGGVGINGNLSSSTIKVYTMLDVNSTKIKNVDVPFQNTDAANKVYVDSLVTSAESSLTSYVRSNFLNLLGGTLNGDINMNDNKITLTGVPTLPNDATNKTYVDSAALLAENNAISSANSLYLPLLGGTMSGILNSTNTTISTNVSTGAITITGGLGVSGNISATTIKMFGTQNMNDNKIINVLTPTNNNDASNKEYVDTVAASTILLAEANAANSVANLYVAKSGSTMTGILDIADTTESTSLSTGSLSVSGGVAIQKTLNVKKIIVVGNETIQSNTEQYVNPLGINSMFIYDDQNLNTPKIGDAVDIGEQYLSLDVTHLATRNTNFVGSGYIKLIGDNNLDTSCWLYPTINLGLSWMIEFEINFFSGDSYDVYFNTKYNEYYYECTITYNVDNTITTYIATYTDGGSSGVYSSTTNPMDVLTNTWYNASIIFSRGNVYFSVDSGKLMSCLYDSTKDKWWANDLNCETSFVSYNTTLTNTSCDIRIRNVKMTQYNSNIIKLVGTVASTSSSPLAYIDFPLFIGNENDSSGISSGSIFTNGGIGVGKTLSAKNGSFYGNVEMNNSKITGLNTPTLNTDATNKAYVDTKSSIAESNAISTSSLNASNTYLSLSGGSITGNINMTSNKFTNVRNPTDDQDVTTKIYVESNFLKLTGGTLSGEINMANKKITGLDTPTSTSDATNKVYVDNFVSTTKTEIESFALTKYFPYLGGTISGPTYIYDSTSSTSSSTGALKVFGGVGVNENLNVGNALDVVGKTFLHNVLDMTDNSIINLPIPTTNTQATNKLYVDTKSTDAFNDAKTYADDKFFDKILGGTILESVYISDTTVSNDVTTGALTVLGGVGISGGVNIGDVLNMNGNLISHVTYPLVDTDAATKKYVDDQIALGETLRLSTNGGTMNGDINMNSHYIRNLQNPFGDTDAVNKLYVDDHVADNVANYLPLVGGTLTGSLFVDNSTSSTNTTTGAIIVSGGIGIGENLNVFGTTLLKNTLDISGNKILRVGNPSDGTDGTNKTYVDDAVLSAKDYADNNFLNKTGGTLTGSLYVDDTTTSTSATTGALKISGGVGISENLNVAGITKIINATEYAYGMSPSAALIVAGAIQSNEAIGANEFYINDVQVISSTRDAYFNNLYVSGTQTIVDSIRVELSDNVIVINSGPSSTKDSGYLVQRFDDDMLTDVPLETGLAQDGSLSTITLAVGSSSVDNYYKNMMINLTNNNPSGVLNLVRKIISYDGTTKIATLNTSWDVIPTSNTTYSLFGNVYTGMVYREIENKFILAKTNNDTGTIAVHEYANLQVNDFFSSTHILTGSITGQSNGSGTLVLNNGGIYVGNTSYINADLIISNSTQGALNNGALKILSGGVYVEGTSYFNNSITSSGKIITTNATASSSTTTGSITTGGGVGIGENLNVSGKIKTIDTTSSTSTTTGSIITGGGVGIAKELNVGESATFASTGSFGGVLNMNTNKITNVDTPTSSGDATNKSYVDTTSQYYANIAESNSNDYSDLNFLNLTGGILTGSLYVNDATTSTSATTGAITVTGGVGIGEKLNVFGRTKIFDETDSTSFSSGSLIVNGGIGVAKNINIGGSATINSTLDMNSNKILRVANPDNDGDATNKAYVLLSISNYVDDNALLLTGGNLTGVLNMGNNKIVNMMGPVDDNDATTKLYVDNLFGSSTGIFLELSGGTMNGSINMNNNMVTNLSSPSSNNDATRKIYVDDLVSTTVSDYLPLIGGTITGVVSMTGATSSTSPTTGVLKITGGVGIGEKLNVGNVLKIFDTTGSTTTATGALVVNGGVGIGGSINANNLVISGNGVVPSTVVQPINSTATSNIILYDDQVISTTVGSAISGIYNGITCSDTFVSRTIGNIGVGYITLASGASPETGGWIYSPINIGTSWTINFDWYISSVTTGTNSLTVYATYDDHIISFKIDAETNEISIIGANGNYNPTETIGTSLLSTGTWKNCSITFIRGNMYMSVMNGLYCVNAFESSQNKWWSNESDCSIAFIADAQNSIYRIRNIRISHFSESLVKFSELNSQQTYVDLPLLAQDIHVISTTSSTNSTTGSIIANGGFGLAGNMNSTGIIKTLNSTSSTSTTTGALIVAGGFGLGGTMTTSGVVNITNTTPSTAYNNGSLIIGGGVGVSENINAYGSISSVGILSTTNTTPSTSATNGSCIIAGGLGVGENINAVGYIKTIDTTESTDYQTGSLVAEGGVGIKGELNVKKYIKTIDTTASINHETGSLIVGGGVGIGGNLNTNGYIKTAATTVSTSATTGALVISGGVGIGGAINTGNSITSSGILSITNETVSTSPTSGSVVISGGIGIAGSINTNGTITTSGVLTISNNTNSTNTSTGALVVSGGIGSNGNSYFGGILRITNSTSSTDYSSGSLIISGGMGVAGSVFFNNTLNVNNIVSLTGNISSTNYSSGSLVVSGGVGISEDVFVGETLNVDGITYLTNNTSSTSTSTGSLVVSGGVGINQNMNIGGTSTIAGITTITNSTTSTTSTTGALIISGGVGISKNINIGGNASIGGIVAITNSTVSSDELTGAVVVNGGLGISGNINTIGVVKITNSTLSTNTTNGALIISGGVGIGGSIHTGDNITTSGIITTTSSAASTSPSTGSIVVGGGLGISGAINSNGNITTSGILIVSNLTSSTSATTGALRVSGGVGIGENLNVQESVTIGSIISSTNTSTGACIIAGGIGVGGTAYIGGITNIISTENSTNSTSGSLVISGGVGIAKDVNLAGYLNILNTTNSTDETTGALIVGGGVGISGSLNATGTIKTTNATTSTNTTSGSIITSGGVGIAKALYVGGVAVFSDTGSFGGEVNMNSNKIINVASPTTGTDVANRTYVLSSASTAQSNAENYANSNFLSLTNGGTIAGLITITNSTTSTSSTTGALKITGGVGILENLNIGGYLTVTGTSTFSSTLNMTSHKILNVATPTITTDAANMGYVDSAISSYVGTYSLLLSGGTMAGEIKMNNNKIIGLAPPTNSSDATTKEYVDSVVSGIGSLPQSGGTMSGNINMDGNRILNLPTPVDNGDATSKSYVETTANQARDDAKTYSDDTFLPLVGGTVSGILEISNTTESTNSSSGALHVNGGIGIEKSVFIGKSLNLINSYSGSPSSVNGLYSTVGPNVFTDNATSASGTAVATHINYIGRNLITSTNSDVTTTLASNMYINGTPMSSGTGRTIVSSMGLFVDNGSSTGSGTNVNTYGIYAKTPISGTNKTALYSDDMCVGYTETSPPSNGAIILGNVLLNTITNTNSRKLLINGTTESTGILYATDSTSTTSSTTGCVLLSGGLGINDATNATNSTNGGSITTSGGIAIGKSLIVGTNYSGSPNGNGIFITNSSSTFTDNATIESDTIGTLFMNYIGQNLSATTNSDITITTASNFCIDGPIKSATSGNVITKSAGLMVLIGSDPTVGSSGIVTDAYGIYIERPRLGGANAFNTENNCAIYGENMRIGANYSGTPINGLYFKQKSSIFEDHVTGEDGEVSFTFGMNYISQNYATSFHSGITFDFVPNMMIDGPVLSSGSGRIITKSAGLYISGGGSASTGTNINAYGLYVETPTAGTNKIAMYSDNLSIGYANIVPPTNGAIINGHLGIGKNNPSVALDVTGAALISSTMQITGVTTLLDELFVTGDISVNTNKFNIDAGTGNTSFFGNLTINTNKFSVNAGTGNTSFVGDLTINTNKLTVDAVTGNTTIAGTLNITDDFIINTNKFSVTSGNGDTSIAGNLTLSGYTPTHIPYFGTGGQIVSSSNLVWDNSGLFLGIGGTPSYNLHIQQSGLNSAGPRALIENTSTSTGERDAYVGIGCVDAGEANLHWLWRNNSSSLFRRYGMHIYGDSDQDFMFLTDTSNSGLSSSLENGTSNGVLINRYRTTSGTYTFFENDTSSTTKYVLIGTSTNTNSRRLLINGTTESQGILYASSGTESVSTTSGSLQISGGTGMTGNLTVGGIGRINGNFIVGASAVTINSTNGNIIGTGTLGITGATTLSSTLTVTGQSIFGGTVSASGSAMFSSSVNVAGITILSDELAVAGGVTFSNSLNVSGAVNLLDTLDISGNMTIGGSKFAVDSASGNTQIEGTLIVGNTSTDASAKVQIDSTTMGFAMPRMTQTQKLLISNPLEGLEVYDTTIKSKSHYNGNNWFIPSFISYKLGTNDSTPGVIIWDTLTTSNDGRISTSTANSRTEFTIIDVGSYEINCSGLFCLNNGQSSERKVTLYLKQVDVGGDILIVENSSSINVLETDTTFSSVSLNYIFTTTNANTVMYFEFNSLATNDVIMNSASHGTIKRIL